MFNKNSEVQKYSLPLPLSPSRGQMHRALSPSHSHHSLMQPGMVFSFQEPPPFMHHGGHGHHHHAHTSSQHNPKTCPYCQKKAVPKKDPHVDEISRLKSIIAALKQKNGKLEHENGNHKQHIALLEGQLKNSKKYKKLYNDVLKKLHLLETDHK